MQSAPVAEPHPGVASSADAGDPVPLHRLVAALGARTRRVVGDVASALVNGVVHDARAVGPGALFCCVVGLHADGHRYAGEAAAAGAVALLVERELPVDLPQIVVPDVRAAMGVAAAAFYDHPSRRLAVVGVTGTNGKTTVTHLLWAILQADARTTAVIGTLNASHTTPDAPELQAWLARLAAEGTQAVALEVSSHALDQRRVDGTWFEVVAFTNLSQDHLEYHATMEDYFAAKASLFTPERARVAVVNADDPWGRRLMSSPRLPTRPFSLADAVDLDVSGSGSTFRWDGAPLRLRLAGTHNVINAVAAAAAARELGVGAPAVSAGLEAVESVPGRFERVDGGGPVAVVVDYSHTPAGLEEALGAARRLTGLRGPNAMSGLRGPNAMAAGRLIVVFGCGGDRDRAKRPLMGEVATRLADLAVLTSDNPRTEDPMAIIDEVRAGVSEAARARLVVEPDRRAAIALALAEAEPGDVVLVAGKGHEAVQVVGNRAIPFDDRAVAREELERSSP